MHMIDFPRDSLPGALEVSGRWQIRPGCDTYASSRTPRRTRSEITPQNTARPAAPKNAVWASVSSAAAVLTPTSCPRATVPIKVASAATPSAPRNWRAVLASPDARPASCRGTPDVTACVALRDQHAEAGARHQRRAKDMGDKLRLRRRKAQLARPAAASNAPHSGRR